MVQLLPMCIHIDHCNEDFKLFCFPEYLQTREQIESCTLDPTHMLTNLHVHIQAEMDLISLIKKHFYVFQIKIKIYFQGPMITEILDQQNAEIAKRFFCEDVEKIMYDNGQYIGITFYQTNT